MPAPVHFYVVYCTYTPCASRIQNNCSLTAMPGEPRGWWLCSYTFQETKRFSVPFTAPAWERLYKARLSIALYEELSDIPASHLHIPRVDSFKCMCQRWNNSTEFVRRFGRNTQIGTGASGPCSRCLCCPCSQRKKQFLYGFCLYSQWPFE